jgi:hypothetical protein
MKTSNKPTKGNEMANSMKEVFYGFKIGIGITTGYYTCYLGFRMFQYIINITLMAG